MRYRYFIAILLMLTLYAAATFAQSSSVTYILDETTDGTTLDMPTEGLQVTDDGAGVGYSKGVDWVITISNADVPCNAPYTLALSFGLFDIHPQDTLFIYDGPDESYPLIVAANNNYNPLGGTRTNIYASTHNNSNLHALTIRFKTSAHSGDNEGFFCTAMCLRACESTVPVIEDVFDRVRNGQVYAQDAMRTYDGMRVITVCAGDGIIVHGHGEYSNYTDHYTPSDATSTFTWTLNDEEHQQTGVGMTTITFPIFDTMGCHELTLDMVDVNECIAMQFDQVQIRLSANPIRTIANLGTICNNDELLVEVSYDASQTTIHLDTVAISNIHSRTNNVKTFIPDGPNCSVLCYDAPVVFNEFPSGLTVASKEDICSICVNYEHSFMGDYDLKIICPSGQVATLKYKENTGNLPTGAYGGGGTYTGMPYGGDNDGSWDNSSRPCDSTYNMFGIGLEYCFSRNGDYTLVDGNPADIESDGPHYLGNTEYVIDTTITFPSRPTAFRNSGSGDAGTCSFDTKKPSDYANKRDYYKPADNFSSLIGCPLNGVWQIEICDNWSQDNGWVFGWSMDLCNINTGHDCEYAVGIDSIKWDVRPEEGIHSMASVRRDAADPMKFYMSAFDTGGVFYAQIHIYDEFGCHWDSIGYYTVLYNPAPDLGDDKVFCNGGSALFDAADEHANGRNNRYYYRWSTGESTSTIYPTAEETTTYWVTVTNMATNSSRTKCEGSDTVSIIVGVHPEASFGDNAPPTLCNPATFTFDNNSVNADYFVWEFGDGKSSSASTPWHTYSAGTYTVTLIAFSKDGCVDSLTRPDYIQVRPIGESEYRVAICDGETYTWIDGVTYTEPNNTATATVKTAEGCDSILHLNLFYDKLTRAEIHASPEVASFDANRVCLDDKSLNSYRRVWTLPDGMEAYDRNTCFNFPPELDSVRIILAIESENGCTDTTSKVIYIDKAQLWTPTVFTPTENTNERFYIGNNEIDQLECNIYNRMGQLVYTFKDKNDSWDGTHNGTDCPQGAYVYMIRYTTSQNADRWLMKKGSVMLLR